LSGVVDGNVGCAEIQIARLESLEPSRKNPARLRKKTAPLRKKPPRRTKRRSFTAKCRVRRRAKLRGRRLKPIADAQKPIRRMKKLRGR